jgi:hypothetical protein
VKFSNYNLLFNGIAVLPELLQEADAKQSAMQVLFVLIGIAATAGVSLIVE